jgi:hypothetical protein
MVVAVCQTAVDCHYGPITAATEKKSDDLISRQIHDDLAQPLPGISRPESDGPVPDHRRELEEFNIVQDGTFKFWLMASVFFM